MIELGQIKTSNLEHFRKKPKNQERSILAYDECRDRTARYLHTVIFVVLGMHKSGTTLVAQLLHKSGINMGFDLLPGQDDYSTEKCEGHLLRRINKSLLNAHGVYSLKIKAPKNFNASAEQEKLSHELLKAQSVYPDWGMKDPRLSYTYGFWRELLTEHKVIYVFRDPLSVAVHYATQRQLTQWRTIRKIFSSLIEWKKYNRQILSTIQKMDTSDFIIIDYSDLITDDITIKELESFVGRPLVDARRMSKKTAPKWINTISAKAVKLTRSDKLYANLRSKRSASIERKT